MDVSSATHWKDRIRQERIERNWRQRDLAEQLGTTVVTVNRWEQGVQQPGTYFRTKLCALFGKSTEELGFAPEDQPQGSPEEATVPTPVKTFPLSQAPASPDLWNVPHARNPFFTGREDLLHTLHEQLNRAHTMALTQSYAISGLGGIGKTQIALEYAYQYRHSYRFVFWISAASRETLLSGLVSIAGLLQLPQKEEHDQHRVVQAVRRWLTSHQEWLLILDNADDLSVVSDVVPTEPSGHLLLTTRAQALGALAQRIEVETMGMAEGTLFLLRRAKLLAPEAFQDQASHEQLASAEALVIEMDFLPLALDQAGAYIEEVGCSLSAYLELYRTHRKELLQRRGYASSAHPEPVGTTWSLSFEKIEQVNPAAADLLRLCAFLEPDAIPEELISEGSAHLGSVLGPVAADAFRLNEASEALRAFSLVQRDSENQLLRVHRLVQAVLKDAMEMEERRRWAERAVRATNVVFPETVEMSTWARCRRYLPQAQVCTVLIQDYEFVFVEAAALLHRTACYLDDYALFEQAEHLFKQTVHIWEQALRPDHLIMASTLTRLANFYREQGKFQQAEPLFQQAIHIQEQNLGPDHPEVASSLSRLAVLYRVQGKLQRAELLFQQTWRIQEQALGLNHPDVARSLTELATVYRLQGKYEQAEPLFQRAVCIQEQALGLDHPELAYSLNGLATVYRIQGKYEQAEPLFQRAWHIWEQVLGPDHPEVARVLNNLALLYHDQGKCQQAESLFQRAWHIWEHVWGPDHPDVAYGLNNLAELYYKQGKFKQAEPLLQRALHIWGHALGSDHPQTAHSLHGLANLYCLQKEYEQAESLFQRVLYIRERHLEPQHSDTADTLYDFAILREDQGKLQEAASLYQRALVIREHVLGAQHPRTSDTRERLCSVLRAMGKMEEAAALEVAQQELVELEDVQVTS